MKLDEKKQIAKDLHEKLSKSKVVIVTDYKGLDVAMINDLRKKLREFEIEFTVVKNSLLIRASQETDAILIQDYFKGPSAVALSYDDPVSPAKVLTKFAEDNDRLEIKAGVMDGKVLDAVLLGQLLSVMNAVPTAFVRTMNDLPKRLLNVLVAVKDQKEAA
ncbi:MAG: 50S ribosomal protein L10 [Deltaproteobacteria bacterium]|nr:50S ribosomal protein L10 [Deltaproteobacteria bacterium]